MSNEAITGLCFLCLVMGWGIGYISNWEGVEK